MKKTLAAVLVAATLAASSSASTVAQARKEIRRLWGPQAPRAFCIVGRESSWQPRAVSSTGDYGLFQINRYTWQAYFGSRWQHVFDPVANVRMAHELYRRSGFGPWRGGRYAC